MCILLCYTKFNLTKEQLFLNSQVCEIFFSFLPSRLVARLLSCIISPGPKSNLLIYRLKVRIEQGPSFCVDLYAMSHGQSVTAPELFSVWMKEGKAVTEHRVGEIVIIITNFVIIFSNVSKINLNTQKFAIKEYLHQKRTGEMCSNLQFSLFGLSLHPPPPSWSEAKQTLSRGDEPKGGADRGFFKSSNPLTTISPFQMSWQSQPLSRKQHSPERI